MIESSESDRLSMVDEALVAGTIANTNGLLVILAKLVAKGIFDQDDLKAFSKAILVQQILARTGGLRPDELLVFGDGYVEIEEVRKVGGIAVGVATSEPECLQIDGWKRPRLINAGADFIIPNYLERNDLFVRLFGISAIVT